MTAFEDGLWTRLVDEHAADRVAIKAPARRRVSRRPMLMGGGVTGLAAVTVGVVLAVGALTSAPPAYALTQNADGSVTVTINDLATAVPALNARFAQMGIQETVVPVQANCPAATQFDGLFVYPQETNSSTLTFTPGGKYLAPGYTGVVAAEQLPDGEIALAVEAIKPPVPSCFSAVAYRLHTTGATNGVPTITATPVNP